MHVNNIVYVPASGDGFFIGSSINVAGGIHFFNVFVCSSNVWTFWLTVCFDILSTCQGVKVTFLDRVDG